MRPPFYLPVFLVAILTPLPTKAATSEREYQETEFYDVFDNGAEFAGKHVAFNAWYIQKGCAFSDIKGNQYIPGIIRETHECVRLRAVPKMNSGRDAILAYYPKDSDISMFIDNLSNTPTLPSYNEVYDYFVAKGTIYEPGGFIFNGAVVMIINDIEK